MSWCKTIAMGFTKEEADAMQAAVDSKKAPERRQPPCWNPRCDVRFPVTTTTCPSCRWTKDGWQKELNVTPVVRDTMATPFARDCWNPDCGYAWPLEVTHCKKCGWSKDGPPQRAKSVPKAKAITIEPPDTMNETERKYSRRLKAMLHAGEIAWYGYECIKMRLSEGSFYRTDFMVVTKEGYIELHDTKAYFKSKKKPGITEASMVRMKGVAEKYPMFKVLATWEKDGTWEQRVF